MNELLTTLRGWIDSETLVALIMQWSGNIAAALLVFVIGRWVALALTGWFARAVGRTGVDDTLVRFLRSLIYGTLMVFAVRGDLLERIKRTLESNGLSIPYPQRDLHLVSQTAGSL